MTALKSIIVIIRQIRAKMKRFNLRILEIFSNLGADLAAIIVHLSIGRLARKSARFSPLPDG
ncbi:hypothetical protein A7J57_09945 [Agrobacterium tumefaciens]|uniref:Uncharacterized protein n=1 Tax=Agrobacterium tumefaciens TaxID=358 RepID=A0A176X1P4_AGRTU|nr:hypothetical protein A7J57_09945 [Agrobacterium tumefaciens]